MMLAKPKYISFVFFMVLAISYCLWLFNSVADPLWTDEVIQSR
jgi:uncharacterized protein with PQ loop repeat